MKKFYIFRACFVLSLLCCLINLTATAQDEEPLPQSATGNAAAMSIFGKYPQIGYTGVPAINIPIYNFTYEGLSLPITLSYNNNLVKPYNPGGWVGLGWDITVGGVINRTVNGKPDDCNWYDRSHYNITGDTQMGYYYNHSYLSSSNWTDSLTILKAFDDLHYTFAYAGSDTVNTPTIRDYTPDTFTFSIGDLSGSFYLDDHGNWKVKSNNRVKVITNSPDDFTATDEPSSIADHTYLSKITLLDNRGIRYAFGGPGAYEEVKSDAKDTLDIFAKSWYIKTITFPNGKQITFDYIKGPFINFSQPGFFDGTSIVDVKQRNHPVYLTAIHSDLLDLSFVSSRTDTGYSHLDTIKINGKNSLYPVKKFAFSYTSTKTNGFKLTDFFQIDKNNHIGAHYGFGYNTERFDSLSVHSNTDHWGYYNTLEVRAGPYFSWGGFLYHRSRENTYYKAEILERITYPTGGYTTYAWEHNEASSFIDYTNKLCFFADSLSFVDMHPGGVRIRQITNYDNTNTKLSSKKFYYVKNFPTDTTKSSSSGVVHTLPIKDYFQEPPVFSIFPVSGTLDGESHVTYSEVAEVNNDGSYTVTKYSNSDNGYGNAAYEKYVHDNSVAVQHHYSFPTYSSNVQERGAPLNVRTYSNTGALLTARGYQYTSVVNDLQYVKAYNLAPEAAKSYTSSNGFFGSYRGSAIKIFTNNFFPATIKDTLFNNTPHPIVKTTIMTYDTATANLLKEQIAYNSKRQTEETDYLYPPDMVRTSQDPTGVYANMVAANYTSPVIEMIKKVNGIQLSLSRKDYKSYTPLINYSFFKPDSSVVKYGTGITKMIDKFSDYDDYGHPATKLKNGIVPTAYVYGVNNNLLTAEVLNATKDEVFFDDFEKAIIDPGYVVTGAGHSGVQYFLGDYIPNFQVPDNRAYVISFWYHDTGSTWKYKEQPYVRFQTILPTGANAIDDVCIYPADAQATTYGYNPLAGLTSMTDTNGNTTYYEYDDFQRLVNVKDRDGNIKTHYCYNYAGEETDCTVPFVSDVPAVYSPTGIYVRFEISNINVENFGDEEESSSFETGDVCLKFYADPNGTIPLTLSSNIDIVTTQTTQINDDVNGNSTNTDFIIYTALAGNNSYCLGTMDLDDFTSYLDGFSNMHYTEYIYTYNIVPGSTIFTVLPTVYP